MSEITTSGSTRPPRQWLRWLVMLLLVGLLLGGLVGFNIFKGIMIGKYMAGMKPPAMTVSTARIDFADWQPAISAVGTVRAVRGVEVNSELAGQVRKLAFQSGQTVPAGAVLVEMNVDADVAQLQALQAAADLAALVQKRDLEQFAIQAVSQAQVDADAADLRAKKALAAQQQALVDKKIVRAPFGGRLGITLVNPGQYLTAGQSIVTLQSIDTVYVDFDLPQQALSQVSVGAPVTLTVDAFPDEHWSGTVSSVNAKVDTATRNIQVEARVANPKSRLLPGMFADVSLATGRTQRYLTLPQASVAFNPYGSTVFTVKPAAAGVAGAMPTAQQVFVTTGATRGDQIAIVKGLEAGAEVVTSGQLKLKSGTPLIVDNHVVPKNDINPAPQER